MGPGNSDSAAQPVNSHLLFLLLSRGLLVVLCDPRVEELER